MKKLITLVIPMLFILAACESASEQVVEENHSNVKIITVEIIAKRNDSEVNGMPMELTARLNEESNQNLEYHWTIESIEDFVGFVIPESGPQQKMINSGEPVELGLFSEVMWEEGAMIELDVNLQVKDKDTSVVIGEDDIVIVNNEGIYSVK